MCSLLYVFHEESESAVRIDQFLDPGEKMKKTKLQELRFFVFLWISAREGFPKYLSNTLRSLPKLPLSIFLVSTPKKTGQKDRRDV